MLSWAARTLHIPRLSSGSQRSYVLEGIRKGKGPAPQPPRISFEGSQQDAAGPAVAGAGSSAAAAGAGTAAPEGAWVISVAPLEGAGGAGRKSS